jgi:methionyl-tRNA synthetase
VSFKKYWFEGGLKDWNITRNIDWGIKFPGSKDLVLYVWFDAPIGYIQSTEEWAERTGGDWEHYWKGPGKLIHFIGPGIVYHHCLFWPSMLHGSDYSVPDVIVASGTMKVEGHVFSKSRGYVIWVYDDYLVNDLDPDVLRYYIASYTGQQRDLDFSWETYGEKVNKELVGSLGNFIYRSMLFAYRNYKELPKGNVEPEVRDQVERAIDVIRDGVDEYEFKKVSDAILGLADFGNKYIQKNEPWKIDKTDPEKARDIIHNVVWLTKALAVFVEPIMPNKSKEIWNQLGNPSENVPLYEALAPLEAGRKIEKPEPLFDQIPEEEIAALTEAMVRRIYSAKG